ncbi:MAG: alkaline phosphatase family protein, partial [Acidobacteria bacterium]
MRFSINRRTPILTLVPLVLLLSCRAGEPIGAEPQPTADAPRLIILIVVDQCRADYLERFRPLLKHGLLQLLEEGIVFTNALHHHSDTKTAPGHASLVTGKHPSHHGVIANEWFDPVSGGTVDAVEDDRYNPEWSPHQLLASTLGDWLKVSDPKSKVFGASGKPRAAVLMAGKTGDASYWYEEDTGRFVTSDYYQEDEPAWLTEFHRELYVDRYFGQAWEPLPEVVTADVGYEIEPVAREPFGHRFPHPLGRATVAPEEHFYEDLFESSPFVDEYLGVFARALIRSEGLGKDDATDFLGLSFSAADKVGHHWGPNSPELLDVILRLDRTLGDLLAFVDQEIGREQVVVTLTSDHGVNPLQAYLQRHEVDARRLGVDDILCFQRLAGGLEQRFGEGKWFAANLRFDRELAAARGIALGELEAETRRLLEGCPGVARVWTRSELESGVAAREPLGDFFTNSFHPDRSPDLMVQLEEHFLAWTSLATTHGSVYPYDTHVPWLLRVPSGAAGVVTEPVFTVDVAPTLARLVGLTPPDDIDGVDRS